MYDKMDFSREQRILHLATALSAGTATSEEVQEAADSLSYAAGERMGLERKVAAYEKALAWYLRVMKTFADLDMTDELWWRFVNNEMQFHILCEGMFAAEADDLGYDSEELTMENYHLLESSIEDVRDAGLGSEGMHWALVLFVARARTQRPVSTLFDAIPDTIKPLFDTADVL